jgi:hypothetical protein
MRPAYHSPERLAGGTISTDDDTWAVAVMLYFLLTGAMPFSGETAPELRAQMARGGSAPLAVFDAGDDRLQAILDAFLERNHGSRARSLGAFRAALEDWRGPGEVFLPLEDGEDDAGDFDDDDDDDDEENVATVMRDFSDVRAQLEALQKAHGGRGPAVPPSGGARSSPRAAEPPARPAPRPPPPRDLPRGLPNRPGVPTAPHVTAPPAAVPPAVASAPGLPAIHEAFEDDDSEDLATMLMETEGTELQDAIRDALAKRDAAARSGEHPVPANRAGGFGPPSTASRAAGPPAAEAGTSPLGGQNPPPGWPAGQPSVGTNGPPGSGPAPGPSLGMGAQGAPGMGAQGAPGMDASQPGPAMGGSGMGAQGPGMGALGVGPMGMGPAAVGEEPPPRSGIRTALIISSVLLVLVVIWIALLLLERSGLIVLPV